MCSNYVQFSVVVVVVVSVRMEFREPTTSTGQQLHSLLTNWARQSPQGISWTDLDRIFFMYASKLSHEDSFISALYGQKVLKKQPCVFVSNSSWLIYMLVYVVYTTFVELLQ